MQSLFPDLRYSSDAFWNEAIFVADIRLKYIANI